MRVHQFKLGNIEINIEFSTRRDWNLEKELGKFLIENELIKYEGEVDLQPEKQKPKTTIVSEGIAAWCQVCKDSKFNLRIHNGVTTCFHCVEIENRRKREQEFLK